ncbi:VanZ family protein [uncultured Tessaracoccus sp.]|uniref:VanZ family protein n=1 Tax=uncultured Tessaracoccus sp. TaxID=905023 RepID=UPI0025F5E2C5|nr:VanZ family protein [uncultured Tessaracoccus sp.]
MIEQILVATMIGLAVSALLFLPLVIWQYRRFGRFEGMRMVWTVAGFVYTAGLIALTIFPIPDFSGEFCATRATSPEFDVTRVPKEIVAKIDDVGLAAAVRSWVVLEPVFNILLFVPLGFLVRRVFELPRVVVVGLGLLTSAVIETAQLTGNFGLMPCPYRLADVTDLVTNTSGAVVGVILEALVPRWMSHRDELLATRDLPRPVTRRRRLGGMLFDACYLGIASLTASVVTVVGLTVLHAGLRGDRWDPADQPPTDRPASLAAWAVSMVVVLWPALAGSGASLGQRSVRLRPEPASRGRLVLRALSVQGVLLTGTLVPWAVPRVGPFLPGVGLLLPTAAVVAALVDPRGLSFLLTGLAIVDERACRRAPVSAGRRGAPAWPPRT